MNITQRDSVGTVEDLHASATKIVGLTDFGGDEYLEPLQVLLDSYASDEQLTPYGNKVKRAELRGALVARLLSEAAFAQHRTDIPIERPIFVTGLPRTGTTALHRLLCADPSHQGLELWLAEMPQPRPPRETWADNPIYQHIAANFEKFHADNPDFAGVHYMAADTVEECWQLLAAVADVDLVREPGLPAVLLVLAGRTGLDAGVRAASPQPRADRLERSPTGAGS